MMFNWLIHRINDRVAASLPYAGVVVDLGCGSAPYRELILKRAERYIGVDWPEGCHGAAGVDIFADLTGPFPASDCFADTVVCFQVIEHIPEPGAFLAECRRILKPGGNLFITTPFMWRVHEAPHDYYRFTRYGLQHLLAKAGFESVEVRENTGFWQSWVLKFNYHTSGLAKGPLKLLCAPVWFLGQVLAPLFDKIDNNPLETASYTVTARKPGKGKHGD